MTGLRAHSAGMTPSTNTEVATVELDPEDPRAHFASAVRTGTDVIARLRPEHLDLPTPCEEFDVRGMVAHLVEVLQRVAELGRGGNAWNVTAVTGVPDDGWLDAWLAAAHDVQGAWSDPAVLDRVIDLPWSQRPGGETLTTSYVNEVVVHTWDVATAAGLDATWDERTLEVALDGIRQVLPANRAEIFEAVRATMPEDERDFPYPFAEVVEVPDDAPLIDRLVAWNGRQP